jgi:hypothetical protein
MNAQRFQPFLKRVRLASQQFPGCRNAGDQLKWLLNLKKATLNFDYGKLTQKSIVQASFYQEKPIGKIRLHFNEDHGPSQAKYLP